MTQAVREQMLVNQKEAAEYFGVSVNTFKKWVARFNFPRVKLGRLILYNMVEIERLFNDIAASGGFTE